MKRQFSIRAILIGGVTDIALTLVLFLSFTIAWGFANVETVSAEQMAWDIKTAVRWNPAVYWPNFAIACACSLIGGYVAAAIAKQDRVANAAVASWPSVTSIFFFGFVPKMGGVAHELQWLLPISLVAHPVLSAFGGYLFVLRKGANLQ